MSPFPNTVMCENNKTLPFTQNEATLEAIILHKPQNSLTLGQLTPAHQGRDTSVPEKHNHGMPAKMRDTPPALHHLPTCPTAQGRVLDLRWGQTDFNHNKTKNQTHNKIWVWRNPSIIHDEQIKG